MACCRTVHTLYYHQGRLGVDWESHSHGVILPLEDLWAALAERIVLAMAEGLRTDWYHWRQRGVGLVHAYSCSAPGPIELNVCGDSYENSKTPLVYHTRF